MPESPAHAETIVVGGGSAGAAVAGRLAARGQRVLLLEAGPDYGPFDAGRWPAELLDARTLPLASHAWGYRSSARHGARELALERARVIGGCSAHNGCAAIWGHRFDYDGWAAAGCEGWDADSLLPLFRAADERMRVRTPALGEFGPFHRAVLQAAPGAGLPLVDDLNDLDGPPGMGVSPANVVLADGRAIRWNAAFAYVDPVRASGNLSIVGEALVDRVVLEGPRVTGVQLADGRRLTADRVVLAAGAYGSPAILLRSGVGPPEHLRGVGIEVRHALRGVGENLHDHPALNVLYAGTPQLVAELEAFGRESPLREEGTIAKARSALCRGAFDLHLYPFGSPYILHDGAWTFSVPVANMTPLSRGSLRLPSADPAAPPVIDHGYLTDPEDRDLAVLLDGVDQARRLGASRPLGPLLGPELTPGPDLLDREALRAHIRTYGVHYFHPVGTCKMGPSTDPSAVVDPLGQVHGLENLYVADASAIPVIPRANTNIPAVVVGEKVAAGLVERA